MLYYYIFLFVMLLFCVNVPLLIWGDILNLKLEDLIVMPEVDEVSPRSAESHCLNLTTKDRIGGGQCLRTTRKYKSSVQQY